MEKLIINTFHSKAPLALRDPFEKPGDDRPKRSAEEETFEKATDIEEYILCRQCHHAITQPSERITVQESHCHTFANPHGIIFQIECFRSAQGCGYVGPASVEWSWFRGYSWRLAVCGMCLTHIGWLYTSPGCDYFNGLIVDRLIAS